MRLNFNRTVSARVRTKRVFPRPGTPSRSACPPIKRQTSAPSTISLLPTITRPISVRISSKARWNCSTCCVISDIVLLSFSMEGIEIGAYLLAQRYGNMLLVEHAFGLTLAGDHGLVIGGGSAGTIRVSQKLDGEFVALLGTSAENHAVGRMAWRVGMHGEVVNELLQRAGFALSCFTAFAVCDQQVGFGFSGVSHGREVFVTAEEGSPVGRTARKKPKTRCAKPKSRSLLASCQKGQKRLLVKRTYLPPLSHALSEAHAGNLAEKLFEESQLLRVEVLRVLQHFGNLSQLLGGAV